MVIQEHKMLQQSQHPGESESIHVVGIGGSLRPGSYTRMAVAIALEGAADAGASTHLIDLRDYKLPFCAGKTGELERSDDVLRLRKEVQQAQGIILGTPVYHGSFSGVLKNALDAMGFEEFEGRIVGLLGISGGAFGAADALTGLQVVSRALHAWVIPRQVSVAEAWKLFDKDGHITDTAIEGRLKEVGRQVVRFAYLHTSRQTLDFLREWEEAPTNPGGGTRVQLPLEA
jgi:NAD(P)H-dependent FMN reductase